LLNIRINHGGKSKAIVIAVSSKRVVELIVNITQIARVFNFAVISTLKAFIVIIWIWGQKLVPLQTSFLIISN